MIKINFINFLYAFFFQESEIVEVLWKQDVDLGFSLSPTKQSTGHLDDNSISNKTTDDEVEQLKCLEELKLEKVSVFFFCNLNLFKLTEKCA